MALHSMNSVLLSTPNQKPSNFSKPSSKISSNVISSPLKKVLVPIGFGSEEMEAAIIVNVLRRAGANVLLASVEEKLQVECSSGTKIEADVSIQDCVDESFDLVALPGGMPGSVRLRDSDVLRDITTKHAEEKRIYGAICAAPAVTLKPWGLLKKKQITCHPAFMDKIPSFRAVKSNIQVSGELTTSRGPGTTFEFALSFVEQLFGNPLADAVGEKLLMADYNGHKKEEFNRVDWLFDRAPRVLIPIANGCEEIEVVILADILRRAKVDVVLASVEKSTKVVAFQHMKIIADKSINEASESIYDLIVLPGGVTSAEKLQKSRVLKRLLKEQKAAGRMYGGFSSSDTILSKLGLLKGKNVASHLGIISEANEQNSKETRVVIDGKLITGAGLSSAIDFSLAIVNKLFGQGRVRSLVEGIVYEYRKN